MALSRMRLRLARGRRRAVRGRGLFREEIMLSGFIVLTSEMPMGSYQGMASAVPYFVSKIGLRTHGAGATATRVSGFSVVAPYRRGSLLFVTWRHGWIRAL